LDWNATLYEQRHSFVWKRGEDLIELLSPEPGERILDVGCGTGRLASQIAATGARVTGLDLSPSMLEQARLACPRGEFIEGDLLEFRTSEPFDGIFSNAALHWIKPADRAAQRMFDALKPGGRLVAELGGTGNVASLVRAANESLTEMGFKRESSEMPWYFPSIGEYSQVLERAGFEVVYAILFDRLTPLEGGEEGLRDWLAVFGAPLAQGSEEWKASLFNRMTEKLKPQMFDAVSGEWRVDYRRLRIAARRPV